MAELKDWVSTPRRWREIDDKQWGNFVSRWNAWMNLLRNCVTDLTTRLTAAEATIADTGNWEDYSPTLSNFAATVTYAEVSRVGQDRHVRMRAVLTAAPTGVIGVSIPEDTTRTGLATAGQVVGTISGVRYNAQPEIIAGTPDRVEFLRTADAGIANQYWAAVNPGAWAVGSVLLMDFWYTVV